MDKLSGRRVVSRLFWLALLLLHVAVIPSVWSKLDSAVDVEGGLSGLLRFAGLAISAGFFVLKVVDVSWLRMRPGWRSAVVAVAIVAVLHVGVIERAVADPGEFASAPLGAVLFVGTLCHWDVIRRFLRLMAHIIVPIRLSRVHRGRYGWRRAWEAALLPLQSRCVPATSGPRAPPLA